MGSSTTSEVTINTSTESASTLVTNVTATDTSETTGTLDSLDLGDNSGQSEPLLSSSMEEPPSSSIISQLDSNSIEKDDFHLMKTAPDTPLLINCEEIPLQPFKTPRTAPITTSTKFQFDPPQSPKSVRTYEKNQTLFTFDYLRETNNNSNTSSSSTNNNNKKRKDGYRCSSFIEQNYDDFNNVNQEKSNSDGGDKKSRKEQHYQQYHHHNYNNHHYNNQSNSQYINTFRTAYRKDRSNTNKKINSAPAVNMKDKHVNQKLVNFDDDDGKDTTMFPFDREAIDYERIKNECFTADEEESGFPYDYQSDPESPLYNLSPAKLGSNSKSTNDENSCQLTEPTDLFYQYTLLSQQEHNNYERRPSKRNKSDRIHTKHDNDHVQTSTYDQISTRFDQIQPKSSSSSSNETHYHQHHHNQHHPHHHRSSSSSSSSNHHHHYNQRHLLPQLPDLRIDFFTETVTNLKSSSLATTKTTTTMNTTMKNNTSETHQDDDSSDLLLDICQQQKHPSGSINVTSNPLDTSVCTQPRATIVVQQVR